MKKIILGSVVASALLANTYEITPMIGYVNTKDHVDIKNHAVAGIAAEKKLSEKSIFDSLEIGLLQSADADYEKSSEDTKITQVFFNGIKDYNINDTFNLYALAGLGYERIDNEQMNNNSAPFFDYGVGAAYKFANDFSLKLDVRHQLKFDRDKNIVTLLGLSIPFGSSAKKVVTLDSDKDGIIDSADKCPSTEANTKVNAIGCKIEKDNDHDSINNTNDKCPSTPIGVTVNAQGCEIDSDKDGVVDSLDKCPSTKSGIKTDATGCEVLDVPVDLGIVFETNSDKIQARDIEKFDKFVGYLKEVELSKIILEAHTDSVGSNTYNLDLSNRRAQNVKALLVSMGIEANRIITTGYGETKPLVANDTAENMTKNRRVTARIENK